MTHDEVSPAPHDAEERSAAEVIAAGAAHLGIELGSTRIKAALVDDAGTVLAGGSHAWESTLVDDVWTYPLEEALDGVARCYADLARDVRERHGEELTALASLGVSAMMHGYLVRDAEGELLVPFRTWRNTFTIDASARLGEAFGLNIPLRWSVSHLLHAVLQQEEHVPRIASITTLAGWLHERLTGRRVLGVGDASGMFPIAADGSGYDPALLDRFAALEETADLPWSLPEILPEVLRAGDHAGVLTEEGARVLDPGGTLRAGAVTAPPEGDAGAGMVATGAVGPRTGNVSAGTSAFAMVVLEGPLSGPREEIDLVTTPAGDPVAMIHTNNCTGDLDAWLGVFRSFAERLGSSVDDEELYRLLFTAGAEGDPDAGGVLSYNYISGEHQTHVPSGRPLLVREQGARFTLENVLRAQLHGAFGALAVGMEALLVDEGVALDVLYAHGGIFRTEGVAQQVLADAIDTPVAVGASAGEGGAWGMALLAAFTAGRHGAGPDPDPSAPAADLTAHLAEHVFADLDPVVRRPQPEGVAGFARWLEAYRAALPVERLAGEILD